MLEPAPDIGQGELNVMLFLDPNLDLSSFVDWNRPLQHISGHTMDQPLIAYDLLLYSLEVP